jgi:hypothetical protein
MTAFETGDETTEGAETGRRSPPSCERCGGETRFSGGESTHDLYAERFTCVDCGTDTFRSFGRGSVS